MSLSAPTTYSLEAEREVKELWNNEESRGEICYSAAMGIFLFLVLKMRLTIGSWKILLNKLWLNASSPSGFECIQGMYIEKGS